MHLSHALYPVRISPHCNNACPYIHVVIHVCRAYDLGDELDRAAWIDDTRHCAAESIVKRAAADGALRPSRYGAAPTHTAPTSNNNTTGPAVDLPTLRLALRACIARLAQDAFLRCEGESATGGPRPASAGGYRPAGASEVTVPSGITSLSVGEWAILLKHPSLTRTPPARPLPRFDSAWMDRAEGFIPELHSAKASSGKGGRRASKTQRSRSRAAQHAQHAAQPSEQASWETSSNSDSGSSKDEDTCLDTTQTSTDNDEQHTADSNSDSNQQTASRSQSDADTTDGCAQQDDDHAARFDTSQQEPREASESRTGSENGAPSWGSEKSETLPVVSVTDDEIACMDALAAVELARRVMAALEAWYPQTHINGMNNVWIVKPAGKSRGRGIRLFNDMEALTAYVKGE